MNTGTDIVSMDVIWSKVLQAYVRCHLRGGAVTLLRGVGRFHRLIPLSPVLWCNTRKRSPHVRESGFRNPRSFTCGIRNPGSIILPVESRIFGFEIWNLTNDWRPESKFHHQRLEFSAWNPESMAWNLESETILDSLTFSGVRASWQEKYFSALQLLASVSPWKLPFSPGQRVFFFRTSTLFLHFYHEVSCQFHATCRSVDCMCSP